MDAELHRRSFLAALSAVAAAGPASAQVTRVEVPFQLRHNQPLVRLTVDRNGPYWFLLDTGASDFVIDTRLAQELRLQAVGSGRSQGAVGRINVVYVQAGEVFVEGGIRERNIYMGAIPLSGNFRGLFPMTRNAPEIGFDFTRSRFIVDTRPPDTHPGFERIRVGMETGVRVRTAREGADPSPRIQVTIDGAPATLLLDTGANGAVFLNPDYVRRRGLWSSDRPYRDSAAVGVAGPFRTRSTTLESLQLSRWRFQNLPVELGDPNDSNRDGWGEHDGLLGVEVLRRFDFFLKPRRDEMWVRANEHLGDIYRQDRSGMAVDRRDGQVVVTRVDEDGPAARAGVRAGDIVVSAPGGSMQGLEWALTEEPGTPVPMTVRTGDAAPRTATVVLGDLFAE